MTHTTPNSASDDDGLLLWQRVHRDTGKPTNAPPQKLRPGTAPAPTGGQTHSSVVKPRGSQSNRDTGTQPPVRRRVATVPPLEGPVDAQPNTYILVLPRWDIAWEDKTKGRGRNKHYVIGKSGKRVRIRRVWDALKGNQRTGSWHARHKAVAEVVRSVVEAARRAGLPASAKRLTVQLVWAPGDRRRADEDNLVGIAKPCSDALARGRADLPGLQVVPDDTPEWMSKPTPRIDRPPAEGLWLEVTVTR